MAHVFEDRVKETSTTTGTGTLTLAGAVSGFRAFSDVCANLDTAWYAVAHQSAAEWEVGLGTWGTGGTLARTTVLESSNAGAAVSFSAGTKDVFLTAPAAKTLVQDVNGAVTVKQTSGTALYVGSDASDNGSDYLGIWIDQVCSQVDRFSIGLGCVNVFAPSGAVTASQAIQSAGDFWGWVGLNTVSASASETFDEHRGISAQVSAFADNGKAVTITDSSGIKVTSPTVVETGTGTVTVGSHFGLEIKDQSPMGATNSGAIRIANNNPIYYRNAAGVANKVLLNLDSSDNVIFGDSSVAALLNGAVILSIGPFGLTDGVAEPSAIGGFSQQYVDAADGILKIKHGDGEVVVLQFGHGDAIALAGGYALP